MRRAHLIAAAVVAVGLTSCSDAGPDARSGNATPTAGPSSTDAPDPFPPLPPGEDFDPRGYDPEGDRRPGERPTADAAR